MTDDLLARLEVHLTKLRKVTFDCGHFDDSDFATVEAAIAELRSREATIRECARICQRLGMVGIPIPRTTHQRGAVWHDCEAEILKLLEPK